MKRFARYLLLSACLLLLTAIVPPPPAYSNGDPDEIIERGENYPPTLPPWLGGEQGGHGRLVGPRGTPVVSTVDDEGLRSDQLAGIKMIVPPRFWMLMQMLLAGW